MRAGRHEENDADGDQDDAESDCKGGHQTAPAETNPVAQPQNADEFAFILVIHLQLDGNFVNAPGSESA
jgi:hypothetical protein